MFTDSLIYNIGLVMVLVYLLINADDFFWDLASLVVKWRKKHQPLDFEDLQKTPPKLLAMAIPAWQEDNVLEAVIDNLIESTMYPTSMYHIFLGIYPNDLPTLAAAQRLVGKHPNVHLVINPLTGPTNKAQNLNHVITQMKAFETTHGVRFASLTIHDSEDVVHPYELKITNHMLDTHGALQFPVFPLLPRPSFRNFFSHLTSTTYADEFAENHYTLLPSRYKLGAFVPCAGTGFALRRDVLDSFGDGDVLPQDSLAEDYRLSLLLYEKGIQMRYVLEKIPRITDENTVKFDYVATRSLFPNTFKSAVRQKNRWILGITLQSFKFRDIFRKNNMPFSGRYTLYKDLKVLVTNLFFFLGYPVLIYLVVFPLYSLSWWLSLCVAVLMIQRQIMRGISICQVYGPRSMFFSCLLPPLLPIRFIWGNLINFCATVGALRRYRQPSPLEASDKTAEKNQPSAFKQLDWAKTDHTFLEKGILMRYHRKLGDVLLEHGYLTTDQLEQVLQNSDVSTPLGKYCLDHHLITAKEMYIALAQLKKIEYIDLTHTERFNLAQYKDRFDSDTLQSLSALPIMNNANEYVMVFCEESPPFAQSILRNYYKIDIKALFSTKAEITTAIKTLYQDQNQESEALPVSHPILNLYHQGHIDYIQAAIALNYSFSNTLAEHAILKYMGLTYTNDKSALEEHLL